MQQACFKCSRLVLNAAVVSEMLHAWYVLNAAVALMGFRLCLIILTSKRQYPFKLEFFPPGRKKTFGLIKCV